MHLVKDFQKHPTPPFYLAAVSNYSMWKMENTFNFKKYVFKFASLKYEWAHAQKHIIKEVSNFLVYSPFFLASLYWKWIACFFDVQALRPFT